MAEVFVARQPIFTRTLDVAGYELLFRSGEASRAGDFDRAQRLVRGAGDLYLEALMWAKAERNEPARMVALGGATGGEGRGRKAR